MSYAVGIDIGGTKTAIGLVDSEGNMKEKVSLPTDQTVTPGEMVNRMAIAVKQLVDQAGVAVESLVGIGIGAPGPLNTKLGQIAEPPNLRGWWGFPVVKAVKQHFDLPVFFENDATAAALAEKWIGAAQDSQNFIYITISTGIGAGIYSHGRLITGATGNAGDVGHFVVAPEVGQCVCGQEGCWEFVASGTAIARQASELLGRTVTTKEAIDMAGSGEHPEMTALIERIYRYIGIGCVTLINTQDPELIVLGGGVSQVGDPMFTAVRDYVSKYALNPTGRQTKIIPAALSQEAGLIGAAALVHVSY